MYRGLLLALVLVALVAPAWAAGDTAAVAVAADTDADRNGIPDGVDTPGEDAFPPAPVVSSCDGQWVDFPYCNEGSSSALTLRPRDPGPDQLFFLTQTAYEEDVVWLVAEQPASEMDRCCPENSPTVGGMVFDTLTRCAELPTLYVANVTTGSGTIRELDVYFDGPVVGGHCGSGGVDDIACSLPNHCPERRVLSFAGLDPGDRVEAMTLINLPSATNLDQPLLVVSNTTDRRLYFVDPSSPSCTAKDVAVRGSCTLRLDGRDLAPTAMTWLGKGFLVVATRSTPRLYLVSVAQTPIGITCEVVESCSPAGLTSPDGMAYFAEQGTLFVADRDTDRILGLTPRFVSGP